MSILFPSSFGLSPLAILFISISSSSGTICLLILTFVFGFMSSLRTKCLLIFALVFISCLCFCPHVLCAIILELAKSNNYASLCRYHLKHCLCHLIAVPCFLLSCAFHFYIGIYMLNNNQMASLSHELCELVSL